MRSIVTMIMLILLSVNQVLSILPNKVPEGGVPANIVPDNLQGIAIPSELAQVSQDIKASEERKPNIFLISSIVLGALSVLMMALLLLYRRRVETNV